MIKHEQDPLIFIIFDSHELPIARSLSLLIDAWIGRKACFWFMAEENQSHLEYQKNLREKFKPAAVVVALLSREFQWCAYGQAEVGAAIMLDKPIIPLVVPPTRLEEIRRICPMLDPHHANLFASDPCTNRDGFFAKLKHHLAATIEQALHQKTKKDLQQDLGEAKGALNSPPRGSENSKNLEDAVCDAYNSIGIAYALMPDQKFLQTKWDNIEVLDAKQSIVENIKISLRNPEAETRLTFLGVSLKMSLPLIDQALDQFRTEAEGRAKHSKRIKDGPPNPKGKKLTIELFHMDDNSQLLHALRDRDDINIIRDMFRGDQWNERLVNWAHSCKQSGIEFDPNNVSRHVLGYIPPRVGILIEDIMPASNTPSRAVFYAGRCDFKHRGQRNYVLLVGERPYFYYTYGEEYGRKMISNFKDYTLPAYRDSQHNGILLVKAFEDKESNRAQDSAEWIAQLLFCFRKYHGIGRVTLISQSCKKFESIVDEALHRIRDDRVNKVRLRIGVQHPDTIVDGPRKRDQIVADIEELKGKIQSIVKNPSNDDEVSLFHLKSKPHYRLALFDNCQGSPCENAFMGFEMYSAGSSPGGVMPLIIPQFSHRFEILRRQLVEPIFDESSCGRVSLRSADEEH